MNAELVSQTLAVAGEPSAKVQQAGHPTGDRVASSVPRLKDALERVERELVTRALMEARGNQSKAARALGITDRIMGLRVRKYGIRPRDFRRSPVDIGQRF
jgi:DNA-binding NtrC family response regulator